MQRPWVPAIRRANAATNCAGRARLRRCTLALVALAVPLSLPVGEVFAAPPAPVPEAAPADPTTTTTTPVVPAPEPSVGAPDAVDPPTAPVPSVPGVAVPASTTSTTATPATPVTAVVLADVATGAPPLVPQLASQGVSVAGGSASFARPARAELPATGGADRGLGAIAVGLAGLGGALVCIARRRRGCVTGV